MRGQSAPMRARTHPRGGRPSRAPAASLLAAVVLAAAALGAIARADDAVPARAPLHDPANPDAARLQRPAEAFAGLPRDKRGEVDWMQALREKRIQPRADVRGDKPMDVLDLDIVMRRTAEMPYVKFPHASHTEWLACSNC